MEIGDQNPDPRVGPPLIQTAACLALQDDDDDDCGGGGGVDDDSRAFLVFEELGVSEPSAYFLAPPRRRRPRPRLRPAGKSVTDFLREQKTRGGR